MADAVSKATPAASPASETAQVASAALHTEASAAAPATAASGKQESDAASDGRSVSDADSEHGPTESCRPEKRAQGTADDEEEDDEGGEEDEEEEEEEIVRPTQRSKSAFTRDDQDPPLRSLRPGIRGPSETLTEDEHATVGLSGLVPASRVSHLLDPAPVSWSEPSLHDDEAELRILGVPATKTHIDNGSFVQDGFGGLEVLLTHERLTRRDIEDLEELLGPGIKDCLLETRCGDGHTNASLETLLNSLQVRREVASLLQEFEPDQLAERVVNTTSFLRRLLDKFRILEEEVQSAGGAQQISYAVECREETRDMRREWKAMCTYYEGRIQEVERELKEAKVKFQEEVYSLSTSHQIELDSAHATIRDLNKELKENTVHRQQLARKAVESTFDPVALNEFLHHHATVATNWPRLWELIKHFADKTSVPDSWSTTINVFALDAPGFVAPPYSTPKAPPRRVDSGPSAESKTGSGAVGPSDVASGSGAAHEAVTQALAELGSPRSGEFNGKQQAVSDPEGKPPGPRPKHHDPVHIRAREADIPPSVTLSQAQSSLPGFVEWKKLRRDVRCAMLSGMSYDKAMEVLDKDQPAHSFFYRNDLSHMLASMIYWKKLEQTKWARFVPEVYFIGADVILRGLRRDGLRPDPWPALDAHLQELNEVDSGSSSSDDKSDDPDWRDQGDESLGSPLPSSDDDNSVVEVPEARPPTPPAEVPGAGILVTSPPERKRHRPGTDNSGPPAKRHEVTPPARREDTAAPTPVTRQRSPLARRAFNTLSIAELATIEDADRDRFSSFRYFGALMQFYGTRTASGQTPGYPNYQPHRLDIASWSSRWDLGMFKDLSAVPGEELWKRMFADRSRCFYFHRHAELGVEVLRGVRKYVNFMHTHAQAWWEWLHWVNVDFGTDENPDPASSRYHRERRSRRDALRRGHATLLKKLRAIKNFPETLFDEPGLWTLPTRVCYWIWQDPRVQRRRRPISLIEQLDDLDERDPERTQWATAENEQQRLSLVPESLRSRAMKLPERVKNPILRRSKWLAGFDFSPPTLDAASTLLYFACHSVIH